MTEIAEDWLAPRADDTDAIIFSIHLLALMVEKYDPIATPKTMHAVMDSLRKNESEELASFSSQVIDSALKRAKYESTGRKALSEIVARTMGEVRSEPFVRILKAALDTRPSDVGDPDHFSEFGLPVSLKEMLTAAKPAQRISAG